MTLRLTQAQYDAIIGSRGGKKPKQAKPVKMVLPMLPSRYEPRMRCPSCGNDYGGKWPFEGAPNDCVVCNGTGYAPNCERIILYLPVPDRRLHPNGRAHVHEKAALTKETRQYACVVAKEALKGATPLWEAVQGFRRFYLPRRMDGDGLAVWTKAYLDGICDAKVMTNDIVIEWEADEQFGERCAPRVEIELRKRDK